ncbi:hypothetical protein TNCV_3487071 [Trichonephila clavipes]|nr:hypothetical protein TNCV_3487071 [Trichonephila clavipes]
MRKRNKCSKLYIPHRANARRKAFPPLVTSSTLCLGLFFKTALAERPFLLLEEYPSVIVDGIVSSSNSPVVLSPSTRRLPVMNDCPRLEEKKDDNSPVVLSTGTHRLPVTNGCPRLDGKEEKRCLERPNLGETLA